MRILASLLFAAVIASPAHAAIRYDFTATVTGIWTDGRLVDSSDLPGTLFQLNDAWKGSVVIDDNMRPVRSTQPRCTYRTWRQGKARTTSSSGPSPRVAMK